MLRLFVILAAITGPVNGLTLTVPQKTVSTRAGGNVTLLCTYQAPKLAPNVLVQWSFYSAKLKSTSLDTSGSVTGERCSSMTELTPPQTSATKPNIMKESARGSASGLIQSFVQQVYYSQSNQSETSAAFKGRIQNSKNIGNASLTIFNMQPQDTGIYTCEVFNPGDASGVAEKSVTVSVLVPPSKPFCSFDHKHQPELGHLVILSCLSSTGLPNPTYQWQRVEGDKLKPLSDLYYPESGTLIIGNLTKFEEGYYQCTSSNSLGNSSCQIDLTTKHSESGIIIAALIASILAAALICVIVWVITSKEKKKKRKEKAAASEMQKMNQKEPPNAVYAAVPSQESVPIAGAPPNETNEYATSGEVAAATTPENEMQEMEHQTAA
ncbi:V-set and immunoglobulin domain-containing protein 1 [Varanus komodoensis]|uniref:V-set and immunoglobulin domain-containing protein 1 n=1 Tax=Varanus komodoensis TaxID=61221 RepID=UPI001CF796DE|nr:V-set and immunoglobulin domain-containing protein 1 [Varanus komodoensis]